MKRKGHIIKAVEPDSIGEEVGIEPGDSLLAINQEEPEDIFDYQFMIQEEYLEILIEKNTELYGTKEEPEQWILEIEKEEWEELGIAFENGLMDEYRSCHNKCIFCFIDQMPEGMRETLYFKDDDSRLSFLQGNYVTLTNMSDKDVDKIIKYHLSPINISFQTMNPELRCKMLHNRFAGEALKKVDRLYEGGITLNGQIVLCKGVNDGEELEYSIKELTKYLPNLESVSVVPVGLSRYREGLYPLEPFTKQDAEKVLDTIHKWQEIIYKEYGMHFIHASDEWYILAGRAMPPAANYDGYLQLENGVGMVRLMMDEFYQSIEDYQLAVANGREKKRPEEIEKAVSMATGKLAYPFIKEIAKKLMELFPRVSIQVYEITNEFFGEMITVSGLLTGQDIKMQLSGKNLGERLWLPQNVLRSGEKVFLDDLTLEELEIALQVPIDIVKSSGYEFLKLILQV
ncbi:MAG: DUF512 domain-containing protein [Lachnospiraceae bacterium]|nr:DUF512 domain-containing protein [Lachnospiraceae bacterium]